MKCYDDMFCLRKYFREIRDKEVKTFHLSQSQEREVGEYIDQLKALTKVITLITFEYLTVRECRVYFGGILKIYSMLALNKILMKTLSTICSSGQLSRSYK